MTASSSSSGYGTQRKHGDDENSSKSALPSHHWHTMLFLLKGKRGKRTFQDLLSRVLILFLLPDIITSIGRLSQNRVEKRGGIRNFSLQLYYFDGES